MSTIDTNIIISIKIPGLGKTAKAKNVPFRTMAEYAAESVISHMNSVIGAGLIKVDWGADKPVAISGQDRITVEVYGFKSPLFVKDLEKSLRGSFRGEHDWLETAQVSDKTWLDTVGFSMEEMLEEAILRMEEKY